MPGDVGGVPIARGARVYGIREACTVFRGPALLIGSDFAARSSGAIHASSRIASNFANEEAFVEFAVASFEG